MIFTCRRHATNVIRSKPDPINFPPCQLKDSLNWVSSQFQNLWLFIRLSLCQLDQVFKSWTKIKEISDHIPLRSHFLYNRCMNQSLRNSVICCIIRLIVNPMRTTCRLVKRSSRSYFELPVIRRGVSKNSLMCKFVHATFLKPYHSWLHKWTFLDMNQSEMLLEGR